MTTTQVIGLGVAALATAACLSRAPAPQNAASSGAPAAFAARVKEYVEMHRKLEATLPKLSAEASPEEIDRNQRNLGALIQSARTDAKQGQFFTPDMQRYLKGVFDRILAGKDGKNLLGSIMDENPGIPALEVNQRYPDAVPLSTMPPELLSQLPELEEDLEYRFVGRRLVLLDAHGHLIVDFTGELLPA